MSRDDALRNAELAAGGVEVLPAGRLGLRPLADVQPRQVRWLLPGLIPLRTLTLVAGIGGLGKSTWLTQVAAQASRGDLLGGQLADSILVSFEDPAAEVLRPRFEAAGGDLNRCHEIVFPNAEGIDTVSLPRDVDELRQLTRSVRARLIIIDPIVAAIDTTLDAHRDQDVRAVLAQLAVLAEEEVCAVAMVGHLNKAASSDAYLRVANSVAFWNAARSVVLITEDPDQPDDLRLVTQRKANWSRRRPVERHRLEAIVLPDQIDPDTGEPIETARMVFVEVADDVDGDQVLGPRKAEAQKEGEATRFLLDALADGDWHPSSAVKEQAGDANVSVRTLQRARQELAVEVERRGVPPVSFWRLQPRHRYTREGGTFGGDAARPHGYAEPDLGGHSIAPNVPNVPPVQGDAASGSNGASDLERARLFDAAFPRRGSP